MGHHRRRHRHVWQVILTVIGSYRELQQAGEHILKDARGGGPQQVSWRRLRFNFMNDVLGY